MISFQSMKSIRVFVVTFDYYDGADYGEPGRRKEGVGGNVRAHIHTIE